MPSSNKLPKSILMPIIHNEDSFGEGWFEDAEEELLEEAALDRGTCHIILRDEVNCNIQGLKSFHREALIKDWSLTVEGAYFMPAYKIGAWDGKIQYVKSNGNRSEEHTSELQSR